MKGGHQLLMLARLWRRVCGWRHVRERAEREPVLAQHRREVEYEMQCSKIQGRPDQARLMLDCMRVVSVSTVWRST